MPGQSATLLTRQRACHLSVSELQVGITKHLDNTIRSASSCVLCVAQAHLSVTG